MDSAKELRTTFIQNVEVVIPFYTLLRTHRSLDWKQNTRRILLYVN